MKLRNIILDIRYLWFYEDLAREFDLLGRGLTDVKIGNMRVACMYQGLFFLLLMVYLYATHNAFKIRSRTGWYMANFYLK